MVLTCSCHPFLKFIPFLRLEVPVVCVILGWISLLFVSGRYVSFYTVQVPSIQSYESTRPYISVVDTPISVVGLNYLFTVSSLVQETTVVPRFDRRTELDDGWMYPSTMNSSVILDRRNNCLNCYGKNRITSSVNRSLLTI